VTVFYRKLACTACRLAQGPYVAARMGFEPATYGTQGTKPITEPLRPTSGVIDRRRKWSCNFATIIAFLGMGDEPGPFFCLTFQNANH